MFAFFRFAKPTPLDVARKALDAAQTFEDVVAALRGSARTIADAEGITLVRRFGDEVEYIDQDAIIPFWAGQRFPIRICVSGLAMLARAPMIIPNVLTDERVPHNAYVSTFVRSMAIFPIGTDEPDLAIGVYWYEAKPVDPDAIERMSTLAAAAGTALARIATGAQAA